MKYIFLLSIFFCSQLAATEYRVLSDAQTQRDIPIHISYPQDTSVCSSKNPCPVALLSSGYGVAYDNYKFISNTLNAAGYLVVAVQHELPGDPPLAVRGDLYTARSENWQRGANSLEFVRTELQQHMPNYNFVAPTLIGHSNGGDISGWYINSGKGKVAQLITLDHRRVPLPRIEKMSVLSIRGSDFPADKDVLYSENELKQFNACIVQIANSKHNEMTDFGPDWLKQTLSKAIAAFLTGRCQSA
ncbi:MAG: alpha/beta hydrolase [Gammaproteobacteria bacterium HGW-Gammaproteobacteria-15]|nr:MAG: alpha/beta hydrolase [Gammaproteobacteria bacterium HGW-Gammaproteobacteria-15]